MKHNTQETPYRAQGAEEAALQEAGSKPRASAAKPKKKDGLFQGLQNRLRSTDVAQRRAGGNLLKFLAGLLALTLIARGTSGATLARVEVSSPTRGEIVEAVTGSASVSVRDTLDINAPEGLTIQEMFAGVGQTIQSGDPIALFDMDEINELLTREAAELDKLKLDLDMLERRERTDATSLETAQRSLQRAEDDYATVKAQGEADVFDAQIALDDAIRAGADAIDATSIETAQRNLTRAIEDYNTAKAQGEADIADAQAALRAAQSDEEAKRLVWESADEVDKEAAAKEYQDAQSAAEKASSALKTAQSKANDSLTSADRKIEDAQAALTKAENDYYKNAQQSADTWEADIKKARDALIAAEDKARDNLLSAARKVEDAQASLNKAEKDYDEAAQKTADTAEQNSISAISLRLDIEEQQALMDELALLAQNEGILYAHIEGTLASALPEGSVTGKDPLVCLMDGEKGFEAQLQLERSEAEKLSVGEECQVTTGGGSMYHTPTVTGTISAIMAPDENDMTQVSVRLPQGDWTGGQRVEVEVIQSRTDYELCIALAALRSDSSGYYVFTVAQKSSVLGVENVVVKAPVTVQAQDGDMAAIQGAFGRDAQIITGSSKAVVAGDKVKVSDQ